MNFKDSRIGHRLALGFGAIPALMLVLAALVEKAAGLAAEYGIVRQRMGTILNRGGYFSPLTYYKPRQQALPTTTFQWIST